MPGAAAEASTPTVGVGASTLSWPGLALFSVVRCVGLNRGFEVWEIHLIPRRTPLERATEGGGLRERTVTNKTLRLNTLTKHKGGGGKCTNHA